MSSREPQPCDTPTGEHEGCIRLYPCGYRCSAHAPWALAGLPEPQPGPGMPAGAWTTPSPISDSRVHDARAVRSGKRRSNPAAYRAAQDEAQQKRRG